MKEIYESGKPIITKDGMFFRIPKELVEIYGDAFFEVKKDGPNNFLFTRVKEDKKNKNLVQIKRLESDKK